MVRSRIQGTLRHCFVLAYEDVERLQPCAVCGSRRYCFDGRKWRCAECGASRPR
jgi:hypothetical protein